MHRLSLAAVALVLVGCASSKPAPVARVATPTHLMSASLNEDDALQIVRTLLIQPVPFFGHNKMINADYDHD